MTYINFDVRPREGSCYGDVNGSVAGNASPVSVTFNVKNQARIKLGSRSSRTPSTRVVPRDCSTHHIWGTASSTANGTRLRAPSQDRPSRSLVGRPASWVSPVTAGERSTSFCLPLVTP